jgi:hypothetical protein
MTVYWEEKLSSETICQPVHIVISLTEHILTKSEMYLMLIGRRRYATPIASYGHLSSNGDPASVALSS